MNLNNIRLLVADFPACFRFYRDVLSLPVVTGDESGPYASFKAGSIEIALFDRRLMAEAIGAPDRPFTAEAMDRAALIFRVENVDAKHDELRAKGVEFVALPQDRPVWIIRTAHFRDPDNNLIEIYEDLPRP